LVYEGLATRPGEGKIRQRLQKLIPGIQAGTNRWLMVPAGLTVKSGRPGRFAMSKLRNL
jgi:hypothetical protein